MSGINLSGSMARRIPQAAIPIGAAAALAMALPWLLDAYLVSVASVALVLALLAISAQLLTGLAGQPTLGQAAYLGVGGYAAANTALRWDWPAPLQLLAAIVTASVAAAMVGALICRTRGMAAMLATLAVAELMVIAAERWSAVTGGANGLSVPDLYLWPGVRTRHDGTIYLYVLAVFTVAVVVMWCVRRSRTALIWRGIAGNEPRMQANGFSTSGNVWLAHVIAGGFAGAAGALLVAAHRYIAPGDLGFAVSALALLAAIIGGRAMFGAIAAAVVIVAIRDVGGNLVDGHSPLLLGLLFVAVALVLSRRRTARTT